MSDGGRIVGANQNGGSGASPEGNAPAATARWFTTTHWSVVLAAKENDSAKAAEALEKLCRTYWPPLYAYVRREGYSAEDAQDLTQEFFARLLEKDYLGRLQHQQGKFRSFLLTYVKHFLSDQRDKAAAQKRGGGKRLVSLDQTTAEEHQIAAADQLNPEQLFERRWAEKLLEQALQRLRQQYQAGGKSTLFEQLKDLQPSEKGVRSYAEIGAQLGMTETAVKSAVRRLRQRHREILREEIAQTVSRPEEIDEEIRHLLTVLSRP